MSKRIFVLGLVLFITQQVHGWPTYRGNAARTGYTDQTVPSELTLLWGIDVVPPRPAWPRSTRMSFDWAHHPIVVDDLVIFGKSYYCDVSAWDIKTGKRRWWFITDAPIRFAPVAWKDRVFVASDDGFLYCLASKDGKLLWKKRGGPDHRMVLGNERMISKWPARGGPVVVDDTVYFAAGIWPSDGIYLYALDAETGKVKWCNDEAGAIYMAQPHGGANAKSGVSAQGYLVVSGDHLFVPTGRAVPASFNRHTGKFEYFHLQKYGHNGGAQTMAIGDMFFNSGLSFNSATGEKGAIFGGQIAATRDGLARVEKGTLTTYRWAEKDVADRKGNVTKKKVLVAKWAIRQLRASTSLIVAGDKVISGGDGFVEIVDASEKKEDVEARDRIETIEVKGVVYGLAVANDRLLVSTDQGIYCFGKEEDKPPVGKEPEIGVVVPIPGQPVDRAPSFPSKPNHEWLSLNIVGRLMKMSGGPMVPEGFCLDIGFGSGELTRQMLNRSDNLHIIAIDDDKENVERFRKEIGRSSSRVTVLHRDLKDTGLPRFFADLIVSGRVADAPKKKHSVLDDLAIRREVVRLQRPFGGVDCTSYPRNKKANVRGPLVGGGEWTHQYANAANTLNSGDAQVKGKLGILWFRDVDFDVPQRHGRAPAPLSSRGRLFHEGLDGIICVDAYNGRELWRYEIPGLLKAYDGDELMGVSGTNSNFCIDGDNVYIRDGMRCLRLDAATGKLLGEFKTPDQPDGKRGRWGYIACVDGVLYGSVANREHVVTYRYRATTGDLSQLLTESHSLFAIDPESGIVKWRYDAKDSIRHNAIAIGGGKVCLIDRPLAMFDREKKPTKREHPTGRLVALDAKSGKELWAVEKEIYGTTLAMSEEHETLLMSYQPTRFRLDSEVGGRMTSFKLSDGSPRWQIKADYQSRPMINGGTIYAQGGAWDLLDGSDKPFNFKRSYGCGILAGCKDMMLFRSATLGYFNFKETGPIENYGGMRPGCWVNAIPAGGVVLVPDASAGCRCSYLNKAWIALESQQ